LEVGRCSVEEDIGVGLIKRVFATGIRGEVVDPRFGNATIGNILESEEHGASKYPSEIRYGSTVREYPPEIWLKTTVAIVKWSQKHWNTISA